MIGNLCLVSCFCKTFLVTKFRQKPVVVQKKKHAPSFELFELTSVQYSVYECVIMSCQVPVSKTARCCSTLKKHRNEFFCWWFCTFCMMSRDINVTNSWSFNLNKGYFSFFSPYMQIMQKCKISEIKKIGW